MQKLLAQAIALAEQGCRVLPLKPGSRVPKGVKDWQNKATTDTGTITKWWERLPDANVGIATGRTFIVLDIDVKKGKRGAQSLRELQNAYGLPQTYTVRTPSGGLHLYYQHPYPQPTRRQGMSHIEPHRPIKNLVDWTLPIFTAANSGVDIRADGGQVVAPGMYVTEYPGKPYTVLFDLPRAALPDALVHLLPYKENSYAEKPKTGQASQNDAAGQGAASGVPSGPASGVPSQAVDQPTSTDAQTQEARTGAPTTCDELHSRKLRATSRSDNPTTQPTATTETMRRRDSLSSSPEHTRNSAPTGNLHTSAGLVTTGEASEYSSIPEKIPAGGRDDTLFKYMCSWRERGYPLVHAEVLAKELHSKLEQPEGDVIALDTVLATLRRTYKTYVPSAEDDAAVQEVKPSSPVTYTHASGDVVALSFEAGERRHSSLDNHAQIESIQAALDRFVLCTEGNAVIDTTKHPAYSLIKMDSFKTTYGNVLLRKSDRENAKSVPLPKVWVEHTNRQTVDDYGYRPNGAKVFDHLGTRFYNRWAPSDLSIQLNQLKESKNGHEELIRTNTTEPSGNTTGHKSDRTHTSAPQLKTFFDHLDFLFENDAEEKKAFFDWLAYSVRYPERRVAHGVLIISEPGVGKSWFYKLLQKMVGVFDVNTASNSELESDFNGWVFGCSMVVIHELMTGNKKHMMQQLLSLITEERILINEKHKQPRMRDIYANFLCFSNHSNAAALGMHDRRFLVYHSPAAKASLGYYKNLFNWLDTDGPLHLLQYIHAMDLSKFNPGEAPMTTAAKLSMTYANMDIVEVAIRDAVEDRVGPFISDVVSAEIVEKYLEQRIELSQKDKHLIRTTLTGLCPPLKQDRYRIQGQKNQARLRAVRNGKMWAQADAIDVIDEYMKALAAVSAPVTQIPHRKEAS